jgi:hypothetical protein
MNIEPMRFITGDGSVVYIGTKSQLKTAKHFGWREAKDYFDRIERKNKEERDYIKEKFQPILDLLVKANAKSL